MAPSVNKIKKSSKSSFHYSILDFPRDILIKIFYKLPTTTILNCKLVCREFRNTISDPDFAEAHYNPTTSRLTVIGHHRNDYMSRESNSLIHCMEGYDEARITRDNKGELDYKIDSFRFNVGGVTSGFPFEVLNSCRGFLLLRSVYADKSNSGYNFHVYNPLTSEYLKLPCLETVRWRIIIIGLGFGAITEKYKVVCVSKRRRAVRMHVHTLGTHEMRRVEMKEVHWKLHELHLGPMLGNQVLAMNGVVHWILEHRKIGCFDIDKEEFNTMDMPSFEKTQNFAINFGMIHGMLSLGMLDEEGHHYLEIWVMRNYGEQESWAKYAALKNRDVSGNKLVPTFSPKLVEVRDNGEMVVLPNYVHGQIALYDPERDSFIWLRKGCSNERKITHTFIPSFLSIRT